MTPLHNPPVAFYPTSPTPLATNQDYAAAIQKWVENAPYGEERTTAANKIIEAYNANSVHLDLSGFRAVTILPEHLPAG